MYDREDINDDNQLSDTPWSWMDKIALAAIIASILIIIGSVL